MVDLRSLTYEALSAVVQEVGEKAFRSKQLYQWLHQKGVANFDDMKNLSKDFKSKLAQVSYISNMKVAKVLSSEVDGTRKYLFELEDGQFIETVLMRYEHGNSVCVSTQAGCRMGCTFCASGLNGLARNLSAGEILSQVYDVENDIGDRISHIVLMGTGEPLDNYDHVMSFIRTVIDERGKNISQRHMTISTCGLVPKMLDFADEGLQLTLAVSLHASSDDVRKITMPIAKKYSIDEVMKACEVFFDKTGRRVTFEYALISGVNDSKEEALTLGKLLKRYRFKCHVNLIPVNSIDENKFTQSSKQAIYRFRDALKELNVEATIRRELGAEINAACGQLRLNQYEE